MRIGQFGLRCGETNKKVHVLTVYSSQSYISEAIRVKPRLSIDRPSWLFSRHYIFEFSRIDPEKQKVSASKIGLHLVLEPLYWKGVPFEPLSSKIKSSKCCRLGKLIRGKFNASKIICYTVCASRDVCSLMRILYSRFLEKMPSR